MQKNLPMIKTSKIALLILQLTMLIAFVGYNANTNYHNHALMTGLPLYALGLITALLIALYGINAVKKPGVKVVYLNFLIVSLVPNVFLVWTIVTCLKNYNPQLLPILLFAIAIVVVYLINVVLYNLKQSSLK